MPAFQQEDSRPCVPRPRARSRPRKQQHLTERANSLSTETFFNEEEYFARHCSHFSYRNGSDCPRTVVRKCHVLRISRYRDLVRQQRRSPFQLQVRRWHLHSQSAWPTGKQKTSAPAYMQFSIWLTSLSSVMDRHSLVGAIWAQPVCRHRQRPVRHAEIWQPVRLRGRFIAQRGQ